MARRFGAAVLGLGFDTLHLSIAAPPTILDLALRVAAEHVAFCLDITRQSNTNPFPKYAPIMDRTAGLVGLISGTTAGDVPTSVQRTVG
ncbi:DUF4253 domain-containing protein [Plantactinospora sp. GCM10030261]|uniref:DUF4253 domain-containing protein n=1 Tax=Plantactinospora sp. GCM10030261 TaxID=3273420 RepID=UPI003623116E